MQLRHRIETLKRLRLNGLDSTVDHPKVADFGVELDRAGSHDVDRVVPQIDVVESIEGTELWRDARQSHVPQIQPLQVVLVVDDGLEQAVDGGFARGLDVGDVDGQQVRR